MIKIIDQFFNLHYGEDDKQKTLERVKNNISFKGANLWILACAIIIASVGLNVNSIAVIIGAMLISPLMGPIIASGFALGIYDFSLLRRSLKNLLIATITGLLASAVYFYISPFKEIQSELLARTSPNIYDILIAFFGGLVGVIAVTRVKNVNPIIPGVAIATAIMPPLCTAGYGLATGNIPYFLGAFFLYSINCVFICIATFFIVKFLKYPSKDQVDIKHQRLVKYSISVIILLMLVPSTYFAYNLFKQQQFKQSVNKFINQELTSKGKTIVYKKTDFNSNPKTIELAFLSKRFDEDEIKILDSSLTSYGISNTKLFIIQDSIDKIQKLRNNILNEIKTKEFVVDEKETKIQSLEAEIAKNSYDNKQIFLEAKAIFPDIKSLSLANHKIYNTNDSLYTATVLIYETKKDLNKRDKSKLMNWVKQRLSLGTLEIFKK
jgi:uncharacterized hydrophobic protein (TIGR00271 family)